MFEEKKKHTRVRLYNYIRFEGSWSVYAKEETVPYIYLGYRQGESSKWKHVYYSVNIQNRLDGPGIRRIVHDAGLEVLCAGRDCKNFIASI